MTRIGPIVYMEDPEGAPGVDHVHIEEDTEMTLMAFITSKKQADIVLALKLRKEGKITTPKVLFKALTKQEVDSLTK